MNVILETTFNRLLSKYERTFGESPPFTAATAEEVVGYMRQRLREAARMGGRFEPLDPKSAIPQHHSSDGAVERMTGQLSPRDRPRADGAVAPTTLLMPCDVGNAYNLERTGRNSYCLTLAVPGFDKSDIDVSIGGGCLRIASLSRLAGTAGEILHRGLDDRLDRTFLMTRPLEVTEIEVSRGLLRIALREQPGAGAEATMPPRLGRVEQVALVA